MLILLSSCLLQVEKSITFKLIPVSQQNCFLGGTGRDVLSNILRASRLTGWQGGELLSGNIVTWVDVQVQLQPMILPLLITFVKVDFEILMTCTRINEGEILNCCLSLLLLSSLGFTSLSFSCDETSILKNTTFYQLFSDELHDPVPYLGLFCT